MEQSGDETEHESWPRSVFERVRSWWNRDDDEDDENDDAKSPWHVDRGDFRGTGALWHEPGTARKGTRGVGQSSENGVTGPEADDVTDSEVDEGAESKENP